MPNTGKPSRGCQQCKQHKVKCDFAFPVCRRCERNNRTCSGSLSEVDVSFRTTIVRYGTQLHNQAGPSSTQANARSTVVTVPPSMSSDWHDHAINMFFHDYVISTEESKMGIGFLAGLPLIFSREPPESALRQAVTAVALNSFSSRSDIKDLRVDASRHYGKALLLAKEAIYSEDQLKKDSTLATVICLDIFEILSGEKPRGSFGSAHVEVLEFLLDLRPIDSLDEPHSRALNHLAHGYVQMRNLKHRIPPTRQAERRSKTSDREPELRKHGSLIAETCHMISKCKFLLEGSVQQQQQPPADLVPDLIGQIHEGIRIDVEFQAWADSATGDYSFFEMPYKASSSSSRESEIATPGLYAGKPIHVYRSISLAQLWNFHRVARLALYRHVSLCVDEVVKRAPAQADILDLVECKNQVAAKRAYMVEMIIASAPYHLGDVDSEGTIQQPNHRRAIGGFHLVMPLITILMSNFVDLEQMAWVVETLKYIRSDLGIKLTVNKT